MWPFIISGLPFILSDLAQAIPEGKGRGSRLTRVGAKGLAYPLGSMISESLLPEEEYYSGDDYYQEAQGFNPRTWGKDRGGSPYAMGR